MVDIKHLLREAKTLYYQSFANKRVSIRMERPIISFTFDDVPRTALTNGVPILERYNVKATFYVALGLSESRSTDVSDCEDIGEEGYLSPEDIVELHSCGHDIACHSYSHYILNEGTAEGLARDARKNAEALESMLGTPSIKHFSYPYGQVGFKAKACLSRYYNSMRSSRPGINYGSTDLYLLRAMAIYNSSFSREAISGAIDQAERHGGWLIFYTHGVQNDPGPFSCTPDQLEWVVRQCSSAAANIEPVSKAYSRIVSNH